MKKEFLSGGITAMVSAGLGVLLTLLILGHKEKPLDGGGMPKEVRLPTITKYAEAKKLVTDATTAKLSKVGNRVFNINVEQLQAVLLTMTKEQQAFFSLGIDAGKTVLLVSQYAPEKDRNQNFFNLGVTICPPATPSCDFP